MKLKKSDLRLILLALILGLSGCDYLRLRSINKNIEKQNCAEARQKTLEGLKKSPASDQYHYNLIHVLLCEQSVDKALKQMDYVLSLEQSRFEYPTLFLKAYVLGQVGEVHPALETYQKALAFKPEIKIKQNMELLLQSNAGKDQQKSKDGKGEDDSNPDDKKKEQDKKDSKADESEHDESQQQKESQQKKNLSEKQIQQIMKEIDSDEKRVRSQGVEIKKSKGQQSEKNW